MHLSRQITLLVTLLLLLVLLATIYISAHGSRQYLMEQLQTQAQDAGGSLAMSIVPILSAGEVALASAMVDSVFERGFYETIRVTDVQGKVLVKRHMPVVVQGVPKWFVNLTEVKSPVVEMPVVDGVEKIAVVEVAAHPGKAYRALWQITVNNMKWIIAVGVIGVVLVWIVVSVSLQPLQRVRDQAEAIAKQNFLQQHQFPFAKELKHLMIAMNDMAEKLENFMSAQIDQVIELANRVHTDPGTGVLSREGFEERFNRLLADDNLHGKLLLIRITGLDRVNQFFSYKRGNEELKKVLTRIKELSHNEWELARLTGADMVVFVPNEETVDINERCQELVAQLNAVSADLQCRIGGVVVKGGQDRESLLTHANKALQRAMETEKGWSVG